MCESCRKHAPCTRVVFLDDDSAFLLCYLCTTDLAWMAESFAIDLALTAISVTERKTLAEQQEQQ